MSKTVKVTYNADTLQTTITVDGQPFDTSRINGKEIADWAYPFMMRKVKWNGFYDEMVEALGGDKEFNLIFEGSDEALAELKEAWEDAPVTIISEEESENIVVIEYDEKTLTTNITVNGQPFDTSRINGKEIEDWVYPFMMRKVKWDGIFEELAKVVGSEKYTIQFDGSEEAMNLLINESPDSIDFSNTPAIVQTQSLISSNPLIMTIEDAWETKSSKIAIEGNVKNGKLSVGDKIHIIHSNGTTITSTVLVLSMFGRNLDFAESGDDNVTILLGDNIGASDIIPGYQILSNDVSICQHIKSILDEAYNEKSLCKCGSYYYEESDYDAAVKLFMKSASLGNADAMDKLGDCYYWGYGVEEDNDKAVEWYMKAANAGNPNAKNVLGGLYYNGLYFEKNYEEAVKWLTSAAKQNNKVAQYSLGDCYYLGHGVVQNFTEAAEWYKKAAEQGEDRAQDSLGDCYYFGHGVQQNYEKAVEWYTESANQGNVSAMYDLAICYYYGKGVDTNYQQAAELFTKAVNEGHVESMNFLGDCYYEGRGVSQDYSKAVSLYEKALNENSPQAYYNLGSCYRWGNGVRKDKEKAKELFKKGIELGNQNCKEAYEDMLKNADRIETAKRIGGKILTVLGEVGGAYAQAYYSDDDDE